MHHQKEQIDIALRGFLGHPTDWDYFPLLELHQFDLTTLPITPFWDWATSFNNLIEKKFVSPNGELLTNIKNHQKILTGYSLGGRLSMHALIERPSLWDGAIIISANPGISKPEPIEKLNRLSIDRIWSARFHSNELWEKVIHDWNNQSVFSQKTPPLQRLEKNYSRADLGEMMSTWSLGIQDNLISQIKELPIPILWDVGADDPKYVNMAKNLSFTHPLSEIWIAQKCGHRVPWEDPDQFERKVQSWLLSLN